MQNSEVGGLGFRGLGFRGLGFRLWGLECFGISGAGNYQSPDPASWPWQSCKTNAEFKPTNTEGLGFSA